MMICVLGSLKSLYVKSDIQGNVQARSGDFIQVNMCSNNNKFMISSSRWDGRGEVCTGPRPDEVRRWPHRVRLRVRRGEEEASCTGHCGDGKRETIH